MEEGNLLVLLKSDSALCGSRVSQGDLSLPNEFVAQIMQGYT